jgi:hypothetical protein
VQEPHLCPRRLENPGQWRNIGEQDLWEFDRGLAGQDGVGPSCSYCGSLAPDRFMELVEQGWWVDPTDKAYKAYLAEPLTDEQVAQRRTDWMAAGFVQRMRDAACTDHAKNVEAVIEREWQQMPASQGHGQVLAKFYYQHLSVDQQQRFVELINDGGMRIGTPGYFYALPFFVHMSKAAE